MRPKRAGALLLATAVALSGAVATSVFPASPAAATGESNLYLVTLNGPGTAGDRSQTPQLQRERVLEAEQQAVLASVGAPSPIYSWTHALNGFAVALDTDQAADLTADPRVALIEPNSVRPLSSAGPMAAAAPSSAPSARGGAGTVVGLVDSGLAPEGPVFSEGPGLGARPADFRGACDPGVENDHWDIDICDGKVVAARWYVQGFGADRLRSSSSLSPRDTDGHGTQMASIAAGNSGVSVRVGDQRLGRFGAVAPQARLAIYKACWTAPDPSDDGCATADLVTAIDQATSDRVDVLNLSVGGPSEIDTVERALLGAAEADIVVTAAAGNRGSSAYAAHPSPWVTTVGGTTVEERRGQVVMIGTEGRALVGAMSSTQQLPAARIIAAGDARAPGSSVATARACAPGSLDAAVVAGRVVVCERGVVGRIDKSETVALADGVGMVLINTAPGSVEADMQRVPTVHLDQSAGRDLLQWMGSGTDPRVTLTPLGLVRDQPVVPAWSAGGDPRGAVVKPDLVAPANGVLGAVPATTGQVAWDFVSGTSAASAHTAAVAARLIGRHGWSATQVRSALATTAAPLGESSPLRSGAGLLKPTRTDKPGLAYEVNRFTYREWLAGRRTNLNTPSILLSGTQSKATRTVTNLGRRALFFSSRAVGFDQRVRITPAALRLQPGESGTFTIATGGLRGLSDDGYAVWRGANGTTTRIPVLIAR